MEFQGFVLVHALEWSALDEVFEVRRNGVFPFLFVFNGSLFDLLLQLLGLTIASAVYAFFHWSERVVHVTNHLNGVS